MAYTVQMDGGGSSSIFTKGRIAVAAGVGLALVLCFVFIGLYATAVTNPNPKQNNNQQGNAAPQHGGNGTGKMYTGSTLSPSASSTARPSNQQTCQTLPCQESTVNVRSLMNTKVDPCEDFYTYSCGKWNAKNPEPAGQYHWSVFTKLYKQNDDRLRFILNAGSNAFTRRYKWTAEIKAINIYHSCTDGRTRLRAGANPFVEKILPHVGGWSVINDLPADWNISNALKKIQVDFLTSALFEVRVGHDYSTGSSFDHFHPIITIRDSQLGMGQYYLYTTSYYNKTKEAYKDYMRRTSALLVRDAKITTNQTTTIETFVNDVMTVETALAWIMRRNFNSYLNRFRTVTLAQLNTRTNNTIDWVDFMKYLFSESYIDENTRVSFTRYGYIEAVFSYISGLPSATKNRMLSNFLVWQLVIKYTEHLSADYIHAYRKFSSSVYGYVYSPSNEDVCFNYVKQNMDVAMNHLYVKKFSSGSEKTQAKEIASYVKQVLLDGIDQYTFMDNDTKTMAKARLGQVVAEIGYPDWLSDRDTVDVLYHGLTTSPSDYFQNMLNLNVYEKLELNRQYTGLDKEFDMHWNIFDYRMSLVRSGFELHVPVGILQKPIYNSQYPKFNNYGSFGANLAETYISAINNYQTYYSSRYPAWWSSTTISNYSSAVDCLGEFYVNKPVGPPNLGQFGPGSQAKISAFLAKFFAQKSLPSIGGVKGAFQAYKAWLKKNGQEKAAPLTQLTNDQMFFVSYAQSQCAKPEGHYMLSGKLKVNSIMAQLDDFSKAFSCSASSTLNKKTRCRTF